MDHSALHTLILQHPLFHILQAVGRLLSIASQLSVSDMKTLSATLTNLQVYFVTSNAPLGTSSKLALLVDRAVTAVLVGQLKWLQSCLHDLLVAEENFRVLQSANEPFKRTRRRLPPQAERELTNWLHQNTPHPYMPEWLVRDFSSRFNVSDDQVRIFLTNARRKIVDGGVRKRGGNINGGLSMTSPSVPVVVSGPKKISPAPCEAEGLGVKRACLFKAADASSFSTAVGEGESN